MHGIRTFGNWQERLAALLEERARADGHTIEVFNYKYGYFSALAFVSIVLRWLMVRRFRTELLALTRSPWDRIDIVAHSFGTYLVARALYSLRRQHGPFIDTVILAGSVLPAAFPWREITPRCVGRVVNECGARDHVLLLSQILPRLGMAGRMGFRGMTGERLRNRFYDLGHSGYFLHQQRPTDAFMATRWLPLILDRAEIAVVDERVFGRFAGLEAFLLNNAQPIKIAAYGGLLTLLVAWGIPYLGSVYARSVIAQHQGYATRDADGTTVSFAKDSVPGPALRWLGLVAPVSYLDLASAKVGDADLEAIAPSRTMTVLLLSNTQITGRTLSSLSRFPALRELTLANVPLVTLAGLPPWPGLRVLDLKGTNIRDADLVHMSHLTTLRRLDLAKTAIQGAGLSHLSAFTHLQTLNLANSAVDDAGLAAFPTLPSLENLDLDGTRIRGPGLRHLERFLRLRTLDLSSTKVDDDSLAELPRLPELTEIILTGAANVKGMRLASMLRQLPALQKLWLKETSVQTSALPQLSVLPGLQVLALPTTEIGPGALAHLKVLRELRELYIGGTGVTDDDLADLVELPRLEKLWLPGNPQISDRGLRFLHGLPGLRELKIERTGITDKGRADFRDARPTVKVIF